MAVLRKEKLKALNRALRWRHRARRQGDRLLEWLRRFRGTVPISA
jgi:hypothetical protein